MKSNAVESVSLGNNLESNATESVNHGKLKSDAAESVSLGKSIWNRTPLRAYALETI